jgi:hypothetical protein
MLLAPLHRLVQAGLAWPALLGLIMGTVIQLQQPRLSEAWFYGCFCLLALAGWVVVATFFIASTTRTAALLLLLAALGFGLTGLRSVAYVQHALDKDKNSNRISPSMPPKSGHKMHTRSQLPV